MFLIVAHHFVVNSGLLTADGPVYSDITNWKSIFLLVFGAWGKTGINCFVLITGFFMCRSKITRGKFLKLLGIYMFYKIAIYFIFLISGFSRFNVKQLILAILPVTSLSHNFTGCFLVFYLLIPFLNILINALSKRKYQLLLLILCFVYSILGSIPKFEITFNYVSWFCVIYLIGAYLRLYPNQYSNNRVLWGWTLFALLCFAILSIVICTFVPLKLGLSPQPYLLVSDSNKLLALMLSVASFMFFRNIRMDNSRLINTIASTTFGVLLIHANSDAMRQFLWNDLFNNVGMYRSGLLPVLAIGAVITVFVMCSILDLIRKQAVKFIAKSPLISWMNHDLT